MNQVLLELRRAAVRAALRVSRYRRELQDAYSEKPVYENLDICVQLHERIEVIYVVDGYEASLWTADNPGRKVLEAKGDDIQSALAELDKLCKDRTWKDIRQLPSI